MEATAASWAAVSDALREEVGLVGLACTSGSAGATFLRALQAKATTLSSVYELACLMAAHLRGELARFDFQLCYAGKTWLYLVSRRLAGPHQSSTAREGAAGSLPPSLSVAARPWALDARQPDNAEQCSCMECRQGSACREQRQRRKSCWS